MCKRGGDNDSGKLSSSLGSVLRALVAPTATSGGVNLT
jgi:hypothetical protein